MVVGGGADWSEGAGTGTVCWDSDKYPLTTERLQPENQLNPVQSDPTVSGVHTADLPFKSPEGMKSINGSIN